MAETTIKTYLNGAAGNREVDLSSLGEKVLFRTLKEALVMYEANKRQGTRSTKGRSEIAGTNKKPYKQKHTGRARAGSFQSPIWRGGGVVFGPRPRDFSYQLPKKMRRAALRSALLSKFKDDEVVVVDGIPSDKPSTKQAAQLLKGAGIVKSALIVLAGKDEVGFKSFRNLPKVDVLRACDLNAYDVLRRRHLVVTPEVLESILAGNWHRQGEEA